MFAEGRGRWAVSQEPKLIQSFQPFSLLWPHCRYSSNFESVTLRFCANVKDLPSHPGGLGSNPGCDAICGLSYCWFLSLLRKVRFFSFTVKSSLQVPVRNITLEHMYTSSQ